MGARWAFAVYFIGGRLRRVFAIGVCSVAVFANPIKQRIKNDLMGILKNVNIITELYPANHVVYLSYL